MTLRNSTMTLLTLAVLATVAIPPAVLRADAPVGGEDGTAVDPTAPVFYNVYAGMNLTDAQAADLVAVSQEIGVKLSAISQAATLDTGPQYGLGMTIRNPGSQSDAIVPQIDAAWRALETAGAPIEEQRRLLTERFGEVAVFEFQTVTRFSDADRAAAMVLQAEWRARAFQGLTPAQRAVFDANQAVVMGLTGPDYPTSIQFYFGSGGEPLVAPPV